jgi:hypothetical protein
LKYVNVEGEVGTVQLYILVGVWSKLCIASYCSGGYDSRLPTWQKILLLLSSGLIQEFSHFRSDCQSHLPTIAAVIILNIKLFIIFVQSQFCLQEDRYDTKWKTSEKLHLYGVGYMKAIICKRLTKPKFFIH